MDLYIYPLNGPAVVVYIGSEVLFSARKVLDKVNELYLECFSEGGVGQYGKNIIFMIYVNMKTEQNKKRLLSLGKNEALRNLNFISDNVFGFLRLELYQNHAELYDVCTGKENRKQGVMHSLFSHMFSQIKRKYFWLGVVFDNPKRDEAINFYLNNGFFFQNVTFRTPSNVMLKFPVLGFTTQHPSFNRNIFSALSDISCNFSFKLKWTDMIYIQNNVYDKKVETAGKMDVQLGWLKPNLVDITYGDSLKFAVTVPKYYINWHSHPDVCYRAYNCYIGWPSGQDMKFIFQYYFSGLLFHLLFSAEGLYTIKLTENAMKMIYLFSFKPEWLYAISDVIKERFDFVTRYRIYDVPTSKRDETIKAFLQRANTATLRDYLVEDNVLVKEAIQYLERFTSPNFPIFQVIFYPSSYIETHTKSFETITLNTISSPRNNFCPT